MASSRWSWASGVREALEGAGLSAGDVDLIMSTTVTGRSCRRWRPDWSPGSGCATDVRASRCSGWAASPAPRASRGCTTTWWAIPDDVAVLLSVELCSLTVQRDDASIANLVASGLFGDGAAAVVLVGAARRALGSPGPRVVASRSASTRTPSASWAGTSAAAASASSSPPTVADVVQAHLGADVKDFLADHDLEVADVDRWVVHPGGPKVIDAVHARSASTPMRSTSRGARCATSGTCRRRPCSTCSRDTLEAHPAGDDAPALLMAMGPGFCAEMVLLRW